MTTRFAVILNAGSGTTDINAAELESMLGAHGLSFTLVTPRTATEVSDLARSLARAGHTVIVAAGGDGTVSAVASALAGSETVLGILPLGTLNHFAKDVGIPVLLPEAVRTLAEGKAAFIDVGDVNGRVFINNISLGLYPAFVQARGDVRRQPRLARWLAILTAAMRVLFQLPLLRVRVTIDSMRLKRITPIVFVGNNEYQLDGPQIGTRRTLARGCLSLIMTRRRGPWGILRLVVRAALGKLRGAKDLDVHQGTVIEVRTKGWWTSLAVDGEVALEMEMPLRCSVRPGALRVLVPAQTKMAGEP